MNKKDEILAGFNQAYENTKEALRLLGEPEESVQMSTSKYPNFKSLTTPTLIEIFSEIRKAFIFMMKDRGFTQREIANRLGGSSQNIVNKVLNQKDED